jgi:hypothetical protein
MTSDFDGWSLADGRRCAAIGRHTALRGFCLTTIFSFVGAGCAVSALRASRFAIRGLFWNVLTRRCAG